MHVYGLADGEDRKLTRGRTTRPPTQRDAPGDCCDARSTTLSKMSKAVSRTTEDCAGADRALGFPSPPLLHAPALGGG